MGTCVTSFGYLGAEGARFLATRTAATIKQTVAVAQFSLNAYDAVKNYKKLADVSGRGITIEEEQFRHVRETYWPQEDKFLNEFTQPTPWESQEVLSKRYAGRMWAPMANVFAKRLKDYECSKTRYCETAYKKGLQELLVARGTARANVEVLADRIAFYEVEQIRETDHERRKQAIALRKNLVSQAGALLQSAAAGLAGAGADAMRGVSDAIRAIGYFGEQQNYADMNLRSVQGRQAMAEGMQQGYSTMEESITMGGSIGGPTQGFSDLAEANLYAEPFQNNDYSTGTRSLGSTDIGTNMGGPDSAWGAHYGSVDAGDGPAVMNIGDGK